VNYDDFFTFATVANTRGHDYKLYKPYRSSNQCKKFFTDRVINVWNSLPSTVNFTSLIAFRRSLNNVDFGSHIHCRLE